MMKSTEMQCFVLFRSEPIVDTFRFSILLSLLIEAYQKGVVLALCLESHHANFPCIEDALDGGIVDADSIGDLGTS